MRSIYIDNFRGFSKTHFHPSRVNFFVGENSTGKTSILSLLTLISEGEFWFNLDFNSGSVNLGNFKEIATTGAQEFRIAVELATLAPARPNRLGVPAYVDMRFCNRENVPKLCHYRSCTGRNAFSFCIDGGKLSYQITEQPKLTSFNEWLNDTAPLSESYELQPKALTLEDLSLWTVADEIADDARERNEATKLFLTEMIPRTDQRMSWIAPIRAKTKRTYDSYKVSFSPDGEHTPYVLNDTLYSEKSLPPDKKHLTKALKRFGKESGLFQEIITKRFGSDRTAPFEILVKLSSHFFKISNVGYGVPQILPILVAILGEGPISKYSIQQPEVHLHPRAQAALGGLIYDLVNSSEKTFFIETHSDFLIDRFRHRRAESKRAEEKSAQVVFFQRNEKGNRMTTLELDEHGRYPEDQPSDFRGFFIKEELSILGL